MYFLVPWGLTVLIPMTEGGIFSDFEQDALNNRIAQPKRRYKTPTDFDDWNLTLTVFPSLEGYHVDAAEVDESDYPWIARVIHSIKATYPVLCTASCIDEFIFMTSARCLLSLRVIYTRVAYDGHIFHTKAFVTPTQPTKQSFDDIGFIVVSGNSLYGGDWPRVELYDVRRPEGVQSFKWFNEYIEASKSDAHIALGWTVPKADYKFRIPSTSVLLTALQVNLGLELCAHVYTVNFKIKGFYVPCYFGCDLNGFLVNSTSCEKACGSEGGVVLNVVTKKLIGVATWAAYVGTRELPIGFSVPNSANFYQDRDCAVRIRDDDTKVNKQGYLQSLCPD